MGSESRRRALQATGELIVTSRLLVLQSRRMLLSSCARRLQDSDTPQLKARMESLQARAEKALDDYRAAVLSWAAPDTRQFWLVSYEGIIEVAEALAARLRASALELPQPDSAEMIADLGRLDQIIMRWRATMLASFGQAEVA